MFSERPVFISLIIPVYNTGKYLAKCLDSAVRQTLSSIEIIVVNDGSSDNSWKIIESYAQKDARIIPIDKPNDGLASAYNAGQGIARGKYIYFLDSDDWLEPDTLKTLYDIAQERRADVVKSAGFICEYENKSPEIVFKIPKKHWNKMYANPLEIPEFVMGHLAQWAGLYRRDFLIQNQIWCPEYPKTLNPDIDFIFHVWCLCRNLYIHPQPFVHYRIDNRNSYTNMSDRMSFRLIQAHLIARSTLERLNVPKVIWNIKAICEYNHFFFELNNRCSKHVRSFIRAISKLFRENLKNHFIGRRNMSMKEWITYHLIAYLPLVYYLNYLFRFYRVIYKIGQKITICACGLYKSVETMNCKRFYVLCIPIFNLKKQDRK